MLPKDNFVQCHKSFIINRNYIRKIDKQEMTVTLMHDDTFVPIGDKYKKNIWGVEN